MKTNQELKNAALAALKGKWTPSVMATLVLFAGMMIPIILVILTKKKVSLDYLYKLTQLLIFKIII